MRPPGGAEATVTGSEMGSAEATGSGEEEAGESAGDMDASSSSMAAARLGEEGIGDLGGEAEKGDLV
jgi:hypothetical protein